jgi:hypothetical protein
MINEPCPPELIDDPIALAQRNVERARQLYAKTLLETLAKKLESQSRDRRPEPARPLQSVA